MSNPSKEKGTRWESAVVHYLRSKGFDVWRMAQTGSQDQGANSRARAKGSDYGVTVIKRRGKSTADAYVAMSLETFTRFLQELEGRQ